MNMNMMLLNMPFSKWRAKCRRAIKHAKGHSVGLTVGSHTQKRRAWDRKWDQARTRAERGINHGITHAQGQSVKLHSVRNMNREMPFEQPWLAATVGFRKQRAEHTPRRMTNEITHADHVARMTADSRDLRDSSDSRLK